MQLFRNHVVHRWSALKAAHAVGAEHPLKKMSDASALQL
jgi:hypothetical protein